jgi:hypothetical protein
MQPMMLMMLVVLGSARLSNNIDATTSISMPKPWLVCDSGAREIVVKMKVRSSVQMRYAIPVAVALCPEKIERTR